MSPPPADRPPEGLAAEALMEGHPLPRSMARLLVGFDGSPPSRRAMEHALRRAAQTKDEVFLLNVLPPSAQRSGLSTMMPAGVELPASMSGTFLDTARRRMQDIINETSKEGASVTGLVRLGETATTLLLVAEEIHAAEIVIGHKSFEGDAFTLGPNADAIVRGAKVPVTVVP